MKKKSGILAILLSLSTIVSVEAATWSELFAVITAKVTTSLPYGLGMAYIAAPHLPQLMNVWVTGINWRKLNQINSRIDVLDGNIRGLDEKVVIIDGKIDKVDGKVGGLQKIAATIENTVEDLRNTVTFGVERINVANTNINAARDQINEVQASVNEMSDELETANTNIRTVSKDVQVANLNINDMRLNLEEVRKNTIQNTKAVVQNSELIKENSAKVKNNSELMNTMLAKQEQFATRYNKDMSQMTGSNQSMQHEMKTLNQKFTTLSEDLRVVVRDFDDLKSYVHDGFLRTEKNFNDIKMLLVKGSDQRTSPTGVSSHNGSVVSRRNGVGIASFLTLEENNNNH